MEVIDALGPVTVASNRIFANDTGIFLQNQAHASVRGNVVSSNIGWGIVLTSTTHDNRMERNDARGNGDLDCWDQTGGSNPAEPGFPHYTTQNEWIGNRGIDAQPPPICTPSGARGPPVD